MLDAPRQISGRVLAVINTELLSYYSFFSVRLRSSLLQGSSVAALSQRCSRSRASSDALRRDADCFRRASITIGVIVTGLSDDAIWAARTIFSRRLGSISSSV